MKVLFATKNPAKVKRYKEKLEKRGIEVVTLNDVGISLDLDENGSNAIENAYIKAIAYNEATKLPTIGIDENLFFENVSDEDQPGTLVRRVNGKYLSDDEMIEHYTSLAKKYGGKIKAKWVFGLAICDGKNQKDYSWSKEHFYLVDTPCEKRNPGYPLDSISIKENIGKYFAELTPEEKVEKAYNDSDVINFIVDTLRDEQEMEL